MHKTLVINSKDNAAIAVKKINKGEEVCVSVNNKEKYIQILENIPAGFKFALCPIKQKEKVLKYGFTIGRATEDIRTGELIHVHNVESLRGRGSRRDNDENGGL